MTACRHCRTRKVARPRGLCWVDYYTPGVREMYPSTSKYARRSYPDFARRARPTTPTTAEPGSEAKIAVLAARVARGEELFHPKDARRSLL